MSSITSKLDAQTKEITELRISIADLKSARDTSDRDVKRNDELTAKLAQQLEDARRELATTRYQVAEHERRLAALEKGK